MRAEMFEKVENTFTELIKEYGNEIAIDIIQLLLINLVSAEKLDFDDADLIFEHLKAQTK